MDLKGFVITVLIFLLAGAGYRRAATRTGIAAFFVFVGFLSIWGGFISLAKGISVPHSRGRSTGIVEYDGNIYQVVKRVSKKEVRIVPEHGGVIITVPVNQVKKVY